jgi:hypothetical protein
MHVFKLDTKNTCLKCGKLLDAGTSIIGSKSPKPGDASICFCCGNLMMFDSDMSLRHPTDAERRIMMSSPAVKAAIKIGEKNANRP